jgi:hypothetical protein
MKDASSSLSASLPAGSVLGGTEANEDAASMSPCLKVTDYFLQLRTGSG